MRRYQSRYKPRSVRRLERKTKKNLLVTILLAGGVGYFLVAWGLPTLIGGLSVFNKLKPQQKVEENIQDSAIAPPVLNIPYEATNSAQIRISGYSLQGSKVEIYLNDSLRDTVATNDDGSFQTQEIDLSSGANYIFGKTINDKDRSSLPSKTIKVLFSDDQPKLEISEPQDNQEIKGGDKKVRVSGKTDPENTVSINGTTIIINNEGDFSTTVNINEGDNTITITATNQFGNSEKVERKVKYTP